MQQQSRGDGSVGKVAATKAQRRWQAGQMCKKRRRGGACLMDGSGGPRVMAAAENRGIREVGRKENREREETCTGPLAY